MSPKIGRPPAEKPKNIQLKIRADENLMQDLDYCCKSLDKTRSDVIRLGIRMVKAEVDKNK